MARRDPSILSGMKLKKIIPVIGNRAKNRDPRLTIGKNHQFTINKGAIEKLDKGKPFNIDFYQDEEAPKKWYLHQSKEGALKLKENGSKGYTVSSVSMGREIFDSLLHNGSCSLQFSLGIPFDYDGEIMIPLNLVPSTLKVTPVKIPKDNKPYEFAKRM